MSALKEVRGLYLSANQLSGSIPSLSGMTKLRVMILHTNNLSGPYPDFSAQTVLSWLNLHGNNLCLPSGYDASAANAEAASHLEDLYLPTCSTPT